MTNAELETRVKNLEQELVLLKMRVGQDTAPPTPWWDKIAGSFKDDEAHQEAMRLGREYRLAQNSNGSFTDGK